EPKLTARSANRDFANVDAFSNNLRLLADIVAETLEVVAVRLEGDQFAEPALDGSHKIADCVAIVCATIDKALGVRNIEQLTSHVLRRTKRRRHCAKVALEPQPKFG